MDTPHTQEDRNTRLEQSARTFVEYFEGKEVDDIRAAVMQAIEEQDALSKFIVSPDELKEAEFSVAWAHPPKDFTVLASDAKIPVAVFIRNTFGDFEFGVQLSVQGLATDPLRLRVVVTDNQEVERMRIKNQAQALDPNNEIHDAAIGEDALIKDWIGALALMDESLDKKAIGALHTQLGLLFELINGNPQEEEESDFEKEFSAQLKNDAGFAREEKKIAKFLKTPFAKLLGFKRNGSLVSPFTILPPIFNFLKKLKETLGYGKTLSLLVESTSLDELLTKISQLEPKIDFASTAYADFHTIHKTLAVPRSSEFS